MSRDIVVKFADTWINFFRTSATPLCFFRLSSRERATLILLFFYFVVVLSLRDDRSSGGGRAGGGREAPKRERGKEGEKRADVRGLSRARWLVTLAQARWAILCEHLESAWLGNLLPAVPPPRWLVPAEARCSLGSVGGGWGRPWPPSERRGRLALGIRSTA